MAADHYAVRLGLVADAVVVDPGHNVDLVGTVFVAVCDVVVVVDHIVVVCDVVVVVDHIVVLCVVAAAVGTVLVGGVRNLVLVVVVVAFDVFAAVDFDCWLPCCRFWVLMFPRHGIPHSVHQAYHQNPEGNNSLSAFHFIICLYYRGNRMPLA